MNPLVTIITPTYNRAGYLRETIESVLSQGYEPVEYIILDDGSTDNTQEILAAYADRVQLHAHENVGENPTVNRGFELATGEFICVVNSDDPLLPGAIEQTVAILRDDPQVVVAYPDWDEIGPSSEFVKTQNLIEYDVSNMLRSFNYGIGPGAMIRTSAIHSAGPRDTQFKYAGDAEMWLRLAMTGRLHHIHAVLATHRVHPDSLSVSDRGPKITSELRRMVDKTYTHPALPQVLRRDRMQIYAGMHQALATWCEGYPLAVSQHKALALLYKLRWAAANPDRILRRLGVFARSGYSRSRAVFQPLKRRTPNFLISCARVCLALNSKHHSAGDTMASGKFALVSYYLPPSWSGGAVVLGRILQGIDASDYCLVSRTSYPDDGANSFIRQLPVDYFHVPGKLFMPDSRYTAVNWARLAYQIISRSCRLARVFEHAGVNKVIATTGDLVELPAAFIAARLARADFYAYLFDDFTSQWWGTEAAVAMAKRIEPFVLKRANDVIAPCETMVEEIELRYGRTPKLVRNPCSSESLAVGRETEFAQAHSPLEIVFTGAVYPVNLDVLALLIEALELLDGIDARLILYTAQETALRAYGIESDKVIVRSHVPPAEVARAQADADILLIPFTFDPRAEILVRTSATAKLADYLAVGRPILALGPATAFVANFLRSNHCGYIADQNDAQAVADVIEDIVTDDHKRLEVHKRALICANTIFSQVDARRDFLTAIDSRKRPREGFMARLQRPTRPLQLLQVTGYDNYGEYANGFLIHKAARELGHSSHMAVHTKGSERTDVHETGTGPLRRLQAKLDVFEARQSSHSVMSLESLDLYWRKYYRNADVINLHIPHAASFFSILNVPLMSRRHALVWSMHDMWMMTGHCTYSIDCDRWRSGCGSCPDLGLPLTIAEDRTARNWKIKKWIAAHSRMTVAVGTQFAHDQVKASPILQHLPCRIIPYGVDTGTFKPQNRMSARIALGIPHNAKVIAFRSVPMHRNFKGTAYIEQALKQLAYRGPIVLMTFEGVDGLESLRERYKFIELGWVSDRARIAQAMNATDVFLMPSEAEYFGLMAAEAMACGTPVVVFEGTALPDVIDAPKAGISVPARDSDALRAAIEKLLNDDDLRRKMGAEGIARVQRNYTLDAYLQGHLNLYAELAGT